jgi:hypothetical protein
VPGSPKLVYWHRELPPLHDRLAGEHVLAAHSDPIPYSFAERDALYERCLASLKARVTTRIEQEIHRLGGSCAHVLDEHIEPQVDSAKGEYSLRARVSYVLLTSEANDSAEATTNEASHLGAAPEHLQQAFRWIEAQRAQDPRRSLDLLIERACENHALSAAEATWLRWSRDPASVAIQPKEPTPAR